MVGGARSRACSDMICDCADPTPRFEVTKTGPRTIEIFFPRFKVTSRNTIRALETVHFRGPVARVLGKRSSKGIRYTVHLKRNTNYLYRWDAPFLYIDFERQLD